MSVKNLIMFMEYVKKKMHWPDKTEKINIIVRGAEKFLGFKEGLWENINKRLETDERPRTLGDKK